MFETSLSLILIKFTFLHFKNYSFSLPELYLISPFPRSISGLICFIKSNPIIASKVDKLFNIKQFVLFPNKFITHFFVIWFFPWIEWTVKGVSVFRIPFNSGNDFIQFFDAPVSIRILFDFPANIRSMNGSWNSALKK